MEAARTNRRKATAQELTREHRDHYNQATVATAYQYIADNLGLGVNDVKNSTPVEWVQEALKH